MDPDPGLISYFVSFPPPFPDLFCGVHVQLDALRARLQPQGRRRLRHDLLQGGERDGGHGGTLRLLRHTRRSVSLARLKLSNDRVHVWTSAETILKSRESCITILLTHMYRKE